MRERLVAIIRALLLTGMDPLPAPASPMTPPRTEMREQLGRIAAEMEAFSQAKVTEGRLLRWAAEIRHAIEQDERWRAFDPLAPLVTQQCASGSASRVNQSR